MIHIRMCLAVAINRLIRVIPDDWDEMNEDDQAAYVLGAAAFWSGRDHDRMEAFIAAVHKEFPKRNIHCKIWG